MHGDVALEMSLPRCAVVRDKSAAWRQCVVCGMRERIRVIAKNAFLVIWADWTWSSLCISL